MKDSVNIAKPDMDYNSFHFRFPELGLTREKIARVMGYDDGIAPEPFDDIIEEVLDAAPDYCDITGGYVLRENIHIDRINQSIRIDDVTFDLKRIITNQLRKSEHVALFLCTAGAGIGEWSGKLMKSGDMIKGYVVDVTGSETVDAAMDIIQDGMEKELKVKGLKITERYSPGYCQWQVSEQKKLFSFFPENFCGVRLSPSSLMYPIKSISGIIGIGKEVKRKGYSCNLCDMKDCLYRRKRHV